MEIYDKVVLITGASAGIGLATARSFARAGAKLALVARTADILQQLAGELTEQGSEAIALPADVSDPKQIQQAIQDTLSRFGRLDVIINNVGQAVVGSIADLDPEDFRQIFDLNVLSPLTSMQAVIPIMREQGGGLIINVSSVVSRMNIAGIGAYAATKAALNLLSDTARGELADENIRVVTVFPRATATGFGKNARGTRLTSPPQPQSHQTAPPQDTPEFVANKILEAAIQEPNEQHMN